MKARSLWQVSVAITPESEDAVTVLLGNLFGRPASVHVDAETGRMRATVFLERLADWSPRTRKALRAGLQRILECGLTLGTGRASARRITREDWAESWKRHFKPIEIGRKLLIKPSWSRRQPKPSQAVMVLNPGLSFGTGQHPTTRFCLEQLVAVREKDTDQSFLDIGTGSGILAIAAAKLGYRPVEGFDHDPEAVRTAKANAGQNRLRLHLSEQDLTRSPLRTAKQYDTVCANLIHGLLIAEKRRIIGLLKPHGRLVLAGILSTQFPLVRRAYETSGMKLVAQKQVREWKSGAFVFC